MLKKLNYLDGDELNFDGFENLSWREAKNEVCKIFDEPPEGIFHINENVSKKVEFETHESLSIFFEKYDRLCFDHADFLLSKLFLSDFKYMEYGFLVIGEDIDCTEIVCEIETGKIYMLYPDLGIEYIKQPHAYDSVWHFLGVALLCVYPEISSSLKKYN